MRNEAELITNMLPTSDWEQVERRGGIRDLLHAIRRELARLPPGEGGEGLAPALQLRGELVAALRARGAVVVVGATACGKTTELPPCLVDDLHQVAPAVGGARPARVVCTQPRRLACTSAAGYVCGRYADGEGVGERVGYRVGRRGVVGAAGRLPSRKVSGATRLEYATEGLLLGELERSDGEAAAVRDVVIIDEAHERGMDTDLLLSLMRNLLSSSSATGPTPKLVIMSASISAKFFQDYLGGPTKCAVLHCDQRRFDIEVRYKNPPESKKELCVALEEILRQDDSPTGADGVLVFLEGKKQVWNYIEVIKASSFADRVICYPLFSGVSMTAQQEALELSKPSYYTLGGQHFLRRKVIVATSIAETSLTPKGVKYVIDYGRAKRATFDQPRRVRGLETVQISRAAATQRKGRVGRLAKGVVYRMYPEEDWKRMSEYDRPAIHGVRGPWIRGKVTSYGRKLVVVSRRVWTGECSSWSAGEYEQGSPRTRLYSGRGTAYSTRVSCCQRGSC